MQNPLTSAYKGHSIEPLVYPYIEPMRSKQLRVRRYRAAVRIVNVETNAEQTARLPVDFEFFGDARRAAELHGRHLIDHPEEAQEAWQMRSAEAGAETDTQPETQAATQAGA